MADFIDVITTGNIKKALNKSCIKDFTPHSNPDQTTITLTDGNIVIIAETYASLLARI